MYSNFTLHDRPKRIPIQFFSFLLLLGCLFLCPTNIYAQDADGDGVPDATDIDNDNDGIPDAIEIPFGDTDGDGIDNYLDIDSDNDGIPDVVEAGGIDWEGDGRVEYGSPGNPMSMTDTDGDGLTNQYDTDNGGSPLPIPNTDGDAVPDYLDIDSDNDGITDNVEAQSTNGYTAPTGMDTDMDGLDDAYDGEDDAMAGPADGPGRPLRPININSDNSSAPDYTDTDSDDDGVPDSIEGHDTDGDGVADAGSPANTGVAGGTTDADGDGLLDGFDNNTVTWDATNGGLNGESHPDVQANTLEQDWREPPAIDTDADGIVDSEDLDDDNDGIPDIVEGCAVPTVAAPSMDGVQDNDFYPTGYWYAEYFNGIYGIPGSTFGATANDVTITGAAGAPTFLGEAYFALNQMTFGDSRYIERYETPTSATVAPDTYVGFNSAGPINPYYQVHFSHEAAVDGQLNFGGDNATGYFDDVVEVYINGVRQIYAANCCGSTHPSPSGQAYSFDIVAGDQIQIRYANFGGVGGYAFSISVQCPDFDGDGIPNHLDLDADDDSITDIIEAGGTDSDNDGQVDYPTAGDPNSMVDTDMNGLDDGLDAATGGSPWPMTNTDGSGQPDFLDIDADDDGIVDNIEAQSTTGYIPPSNIDSDMDGIDNAYDSSNGSFGGAGVTPENTDGTDNPDYTDTDTDNDGIDDVIEGHDTNIDGVVDGSDTPAANMGIGGTMDADGDGLLDGFDNDTASVEPTNNLNPESHPDAQGGDPEQDWRESDACNANNGTFMITTGGG